METRVKEAARLGFEYCIAPKTSSAQAIKVAKMKVITVSSLQQMLENLF
jgi:DNA repair protein RadA/Sms